MEQKTKRFIASLSIYIIAADLTPIGLLKQNRRKQICSGPANHGKSEGRPKSGHFVKKKNDILNIFLDVLPMVLVNF